MRLPPPGWILGIYTGLVIVVAVTAALRSEPTLLRGSSFAALTVLAVTAAFLSAALARNAPAALMAMAVLLLAPAFALRRRWFVARASSGDFDRTLITSARRLLLELGGAPGDRTVTIGSESMRIYVRAAGRLGVLVSIPDASRHRKAVLFVQLVAKAFRTAVPFPRITLR